MLQRAPWKQYLKREKNSLSKSKCIWVPDSSNLEAGDSKSFRFGSYTIHVNIILDPCVNLAGEPGAMPAAATAAPDSRITMAAMKGFPESFCPEIS